MRGHHRRRPKILIVEDDHEDGLSALRHLDEDGFDLVVLDLALPVLRGEEILREIMAALDLGHTPVIVVTGEQSRQRVEAANAVLRKPCAPDRLLSAIDRHLESAA
jgi:CheY-like chemotaxis protein